MSKPKVLFVCGTRPDAIKTAPVVLEFRKHPEVETVLVSTGQHREMLDQALAPFGLRPDLDLAIMSQGQTLAQITSRALTGIDQALADLQPDWVFAQGDTSTTFVASLAAFYRQIKFAHIEAGLRTESVYNPFPEEFNRRATALIADLHFPPTSWSADNLRREGIPESQIVVTGNTGIDAVQFVAREHPVDWYPEHQGPLILLTTHRRENWGEPQVDITSALREILLARPDALGVVPMHRNPTVREVIQRELGGVQNCQLIEPPEYGAFVSLIKRSDIILTDSGGVQEEAPSFGKPVLVLRETTERPEGVTAGVAKLIGTDRKTIVMETQQLLAKWSSHQDAAMASSPYGDGKASQRIRQSIFLQLGLSNEQPQPWREPNR